MISVGGSNFVDSFVLLRLSKQRVDTSLIVRRYIQILQAKINISREVDRLDSLVNKIMQCDTTFH